MTQYLQVFCDFLVPELIASLTRQDLHEIQHDW